MEDQDRDHISSRSHFSGRSEQELDEMLDELRAGKIGINQPGQNSSEHDSEDTPKRTTTLQVPEMLQNPRRARAARKASISRTRS